MSCADVLVTVPASVTDVNVGVVVVCAILGFIIGVILSLLIARCVIRDIARSRVQEEEKAMLLENVTDEKRSSVGNIDKDGRDRLPVWPGPTTCIFSQCCQSNKGYESDDESPKHKKGARRFSSASGDRDSQAMERYDEDEADAPGEGVIIALTKANSEKTQTELSVQDIKLTKDLENELHEQKVMTFLQVLSIILNRCVSKGKIEPDQGNEYMEKMEKEIQTEESKIQAELKYAEDEIRENEQLSKDPIALEDALDRLRPAYIRKMNSAIKTAQINLSEDLSQNTELSQDEIEEIMQKITENMAALDRHLGEEAARQSMRLQERLARRQAMVEKWKKNGDQEKETNRSRVDNHYKNMDKLIDDRLLLDGQRESIMRQYEADLAQLQENHEAELLRQSRTLAEKLQQQREKRVKKLEVKHQEQRESLVSRASQVADPKDFVNAYHALSQQQREERNQFAEELDHKESEELENLRLQLQGQREEELEKQEESLYELLAQRARLTEKETEKLMKKHDANMKAHNEHVEKERKRQRAMMQEQLAEKKRKWEEETRQLQSENKALLDQQEAAVQKVLATQSGLDEEARRAIMMNHEMNVQALSNQLQMTKIRQQKILEAKLNRRKARIETLKKKQEEEILAKRDAPEKEIAKLEKKHASEMDIEMKALEEDRSKAVLDLRRRLAMETEEALKAQDEQMSLLIGKLTMGQARRKGIIAKQDKAIKELQEQITEAVANDESDLANKKTEKILDRHLKHVEDLQERMAEERESQMRMLKEKFEARKLKKEREAEMKIAEEKNAPASSKKKSMSAANVMNRLLMDQRHKKTLADLEKELKLEMTQQKEELDQLLEEQMKKELEDREKDLLSQLAVVGNLSKNELNQMVHNAVEEGGGSEKQARKLTKDLTQRIKSARTRGELDFDEEEDEDEYHSQRRRQTKSK